MPTEFIFACYTFDTLALWNVCMRIINDDYRYVTVCVLPQPYSQNRLRYTLIQGRHSQLHVYCRCLNVVHLFRYVRVFSADVASFNYYCLYMLHTRSNYSAIVTIFFYTSKMEASVEFCSADVFRFCVIDG